MKRLAGFALCFFLLLGLVPAWAAGDLTPISEITGLPDTEAAAMPARVLEPELRLPFTPEAVSYTLTPMNLDTEQVSPLNFYGYEAISSSTPNDAYGWLYLDGSGAAGAGVMDREGKWVISPEAGFLHISFFCADGLAAANRDGKWGFIDRDGNTVVPFQYDDISRAHNGFVVGGIWGVDQYSSYDVYSADGTLLHTLPPSTEDYAALYINDVAGGLIPFSVDGTYYGKTGYLNPDGTVALEAQWYAAKGFSDGLAAVKDKAPAAKSVSDNGSRYGLIDKSGALVIPYQFTEPPYFRGGVSATNLGYLTDRNGTSRDDWTENPLPQDWYGYLYDAASMKYQYVDRNFKPVTPPLFDAAAPVKDGSAWVVWEGQVYLLTLTPVQQKHKEREALL